MDPDDLAATQEGLAARWQLVQQGMTTAQIRWWSSGLRRPFPGVYVTGRGPVTARQLLVGATLTAPDSHLALHAAAVAFEIRDDPLRAITIVRPGDGGPRGAAGLRVIYSASLAGHVTAWQGLRTTTVERTIVDLWPLLGGRERERLVREALRLGRTTVRRLLDVIRAHRGRRGIASLRRFVHQYAHLPFRRCRSDAEAFALQTLDDAGVEVPLVNVRVAGEEADFCWIRLRRILEIDGPNFHRFADVDARKTATWIRAGFTVDRLPSPALYADPRTVVALAPPPQRRPNGRSWSPGRP